MEAELLTLMVRADPFITRAEALQILFLSFSLLLEFMEVCSSCCATISRTLPPPQSLLDSDYNLENYLQVMTGGDD
jgi:hypothetical protein